MSLPPQDKNYLNPVDYDKEDSDYKTAHNICQPKDIFTQIVRIVNFLIGFIGVFVVVRIVVAGFQMVTSQGNAEAVKNAKSAITNSIIGLVIVLSAFLIVNIIFSTTGVGGFNINPFTK